MYLCMTTHRENADCISRGDVALLRLYIINLLLTKLFISDFNHVLSVGVKLNLSDIHVLINGSLCIAILEL